MALIDTTGLNKPMISEQLAVTTASTFAGTFSLFAGVDTDGPIGFKASGALLTAITNSVYVTFDGSTPSSTNGLNIAAGDSLVVKGYQKIKNMKLKGNSGTATVNVAYFKE